VRIGKRVSVNAPRSYRAMLCVYYFISALSELCYVWNRTPAVKILFDYPTILKENLCYDYHYGMQPRSLPCTTTADASVSSCLLTHLTGVYDPNCPATLPMLMSTDSNCTVPCLHALAAVRVLSKRENEQPKKVIRGNWACSGLSAGGMTRYAVNLRPLNVV
jgi:hypothetical protein